MKKFIIKENHNINELIKIHTDYVSAVNGSFSFCPYQWEDPYIYDFLSCDKQESYIEPSIFSKIKNFFLSPVL